MTKKSILVAGANGYLGRHLVARLCQQGYPVRTSSRSPFPYDFPVQDMPGDFTDRTHAQKALHGCDMTFFLAGKTGTADGFENSAEYVAGNQLTLLTLLESIRNSSFRPKVVFPSTRLVYKGQREPMAETSAHETKTIYAVCKLACEHYLQAYQQMFDIDFTIVRICLPYGNTVDGKSSYGTVGFYMERATQGQELVVWGNGEQRRSLIHVDDLVANILKCAQDHRSSGQVYNLGGPDHLSIKDIVDGIANRFGVPVRYEPWPESASRLESGETVFDSSRIEDLLGSDLYEHRFADWLRDQ